MLNSLLQNTAVLNLVKKFSTGEPKKTFLKYLIILGAFNIFLCGFIVQQSMYSKYKWKDGKDKEFDIRPGENFSEIVQDENADTPYESLEDKTVTGMLQEMVTKLDEREATILSRTPGRKLESSVYGIHRPRAVVADHVREL